MRRRVAVTVAVAALAGCRSSPPDRVPDPVPQEVHLTQPTPQDPRPAAALPEIAKLWDWNDVPASEVRFRDAAAKGRAAGDRGYEAEAWTQVARAQGLQKRYDDAHATLATVQPMLRADAPIPNVRWNLEKGRTLRSSGRPADAKPYFVAAWDLANGASHVPLALDAAHMVALAEEETQHEDAALAWAEKAIALAEASPDPRARGWLGPLYNNTGWTYLNRGDAAKALDLWTKALPIREAEGGFGYHVARWNVARARRAQGRHDEAVALLETLRAERDAAGEPDGYVFEELAENALATGREADAREQFAKAYALLKDDDSVKGDAKRMERLRTAAGLAK